MMQMLLSDTAWPLQVDAAYEERTVGMLWMKPAWFSRRVAIKAMHFFTVGCHFIPPSSYIIPYASIIHPLVVTAFALHY